MTPGYYDIEVTRGLDYGPLTITAKDSTQTVVDLTGYTAYAHVRRRRGLPIVLDLEPQITSALTGEVTIELTAAQTADLDAGLYVYDLILEDADGKRTGPYQEGAFKVLQPITDLDDV